MEPISTVAGRFGVTVQAIHLWITQGRIPEVALDRTGRILQIDAAMFEELVRQGVLMRRPGRKAVKVSYCDFLAEDSVTTTGTGSRTEHRWMDGRNVLADHRYEPEADHRYDGPEFARLVAGMCGELAAQSEK